MAKLNLTTAERLLLAHQLRILQRLDPEDDRSLQLEIVEKGYEYLYDELTNELLDPLDPSVAPEVYDIFDMFRSLHDSIARLEDKSGIDVERAKFKGYDGNNESQHYAFAEFVLKRRNHYGESMNEKDYYNTHWEMLPAYRRMLAAWSGFQKPGAEGLTRDEILQLVNAGSSPQA